MIPTAALPLRIEIDPYLNTTSEGNDVYDTTIEEVPARKISVRRQVRLPQGADWVTRDAMQIRPDHEFPLGSIVRHGAHQWEVLEVEHAYELNRPHCDYLILEGPRILAVD